jgi:hypothetical protein
MPDGFYRFEVTFANGSVCTGIYAWVGGDWPSFVTMVSPADGATGVSLTPGVSWTFGDLTNVASVGVDLFNDNSDDDYAFFSTGDLMVTSITWDDFDQKEVDELPADKNITLDVETNNGHHKSTIVESEFRTGN